MSKITIKFYTKSKKYVRYKLFKSFSKSFLEMKLWIRMGNYLSVNDVIAKTLSETIDQIKKDL
jgi:hypothetical protein